MNDVEHDLRELFERKASSMGGVAPKLPEPVRKRGRRRQLGTGFVSGLTVLAVLAGTVGVIRAVDTGRERQPAPADDPWAGYEVFERTATIDPFTITSGSDWYLVRLHERLCGSTKSCDLLQLTNFDPGLEGSVCDGDALPAGGVALVVSVMPELRLSQLPAWPTMIEDPVGDGRCGEGRYFLFQDEVDVTPYQAWIGRGIDADDQAVAQLLRSFQGMMLERGPTPGRTVSIAITEDAAYVLAGGENAAGPWRLELTEASSGAPVLHLTTPEGDATAGISDRVPSGEPIWQKGGDPVFGAVTKEATGVELHLEDGTPPIPAQIVPLPPSLPFDYDLFFASNDSDVQATAVAIGPDGVLASPAAPIDAPAATFLDEMEHLPSGRTWSPATTREGDLLVMPITFPDGATAELVYPASLGLDKLNVYPDAYAELDGERGGCGWPVHATRADPREGWLKGEEPLDRYVTDDGRTFELWRSHRPYTMLVSRTGPWNVLVSCSSTHDISGSTAQWAELLTPRETRDGLLILTAMPPLRLQVDDEGATVRLSDRDVIIDLSSGRARCAEGSPDLRTSDEVVQWCIEPAGVYLYATAIGPGGSSTLDGVVAGLQIRGYRPPP